MTRQFTLLAATSLLGATIASTTAVAAPRAEDQTTRPCEATTRREALSPNDAALLALSVLHPDQKTGVPAAVVAIDQTSHGREACRQTFEASASVSTASGKNCRWVTTVLPGAKGGGKVRALLCEPEEVDVRIY